MGTVELVGEDAAGPLGGERAARLAELIALLRADNPFHRDRLAGLADDAAELESIPLLSKRELLEDQARNGPFGSNLTYPLDRYTHLHQTSGTTGPPLRVLDTAEDWYWWKRAFARNFRAAGIEAGDRVALAFSFGPHVQFWASHAGLEEIGAMAIPLGGMTSTQRLATIAATRATAIACTPTYALRLAEVAVQERLEPALRGVERVICTGEPGASLDAMRAWIEDRLDVRCFDHAGLTEAGPFGYPCEAGGLHLASADFICEVLGEGGAAVEPGAAGELVLTPLGRTGFPVLRYRTGDVVVRPGAGCPAGHADPWLPAGIVGRTDDMVVIRGMNVFPSAIEESVRRVEGSGEFRVTFYTEPGGMDEVKVEVELDDGTSARDLQDVMRERLGIRVRIVPVAPGTLPREELKARRTVDMRERSPVGP